MALGLSRRRSALARLGSAKRGAAGPRAPITRWGCRLRVTAWCRRVHGCNDSLDVQAHDRPRRVSKHNESDRSAREVLLMANVLVGRQEHIESAGFGGVEQLAVAQPVPALCACSLHRMASHESREPTRRAVIEEDQHSSGVGWRLLEAAGDEFQHSVDLVLGDVELFHHLVDCQTGFKIFKND